MRPLALLLLLAGGASPALAQDIPLGSIRGTIQSDHHPVASALITLDHTPLLTTTDDQGHFLFDSITPGDYTLVINTATATPFRVQVAVLAGRASRITVNLPAPIELAPIAVTAPAVTLPPVPGAESEGGIVLSGKKTESLLLDSLSVNTTQNVTRDILGRVPGANISETENSGFPSNGIGFRGLTPTQSVEMNVRQDGVNIVADLYGYPETYYTPPAQAVRQINLVRGSSSLQFGPQFGGMVDYELRDGAFNTRPTVSTSLSGGTFGALTSYASVAGGTSRWTYFGYVQYRHQDGWRPNSDLHQVAAAARLAYQVSDRLTLRLDYSLLRNQIHMPGGLDDQEFATDWQQSTRSRNWLATPWNVFAATADAHLSSTTTLRNTLSVMASQRYLVWRNEDGGAASPDSIDPGTGTYDAREVEREYFTNVTDETRLVSTHHLGGIPQTLATGLRFFAGSLHRQEGGPGTTGSDFDMSLVGGPYETDVRFFNTNASAYAENVIHISDRLALTPGVRLEYLHSTAEGHTDTTFAPLARDRTFVLGGLGLQYQASPTTQVYANVTEAYRPIEYSFLTPFADVARVDPHLKDPKGYNADLAWRGTLGSAVTFDVGVFYLSYRNRIGVISGVDSTGPYLERTNVANSVHQGVESYVEVRPLELLGASPPWGSLGLYDALAYTHARYVTGTFSGNAVEFAPAVIHRIGARYARGPFSTSLQLSATSRQFSDANNTISSPDALVGIIPAYHLVDWSARYGVASWLTVEAGVTNLADAHYFTLRTGEYPGPGIIPGIGRSAYLTLSSGF